MAGFGSGRCLLLPLELDEAVEPGDVVLGGLGAVLDQRARVDVEAVSGGPGPVNGQAPGELGTTTLEEAQSGLGGEVPGEGQPETEAPGVVGAGRLVGVEELLEQLPAAVGDPVHLA